MFKGKNKRKQKYEDWKGRDKIVIHSSNYDYNIKKGLTNYYNKYEFSDYVRCNITLKESITVLDINNN